MFSDPTDVPIYQMPLPSSHLRQVSSGDATAGQDQRNGSRMESSTHLSQSLSTSQLSVKRICSLSIHDDTSIDVFVNLDRFLGDNVKAGDLMQIIALNGAAYTSTDGSGPQLPSQAKNDQPCTDNEFTPSTANARGPGQNRKHDHPELTSDLSQRYIFAVKNMTSEHKVKHPECQVCCVSLTKSRIY